MLCQVETSVTQGNKSIQKNAVVPFPISARAEVLRTLFGYHSRSQSPRSVLSFFFLSSVEDPGFSSSFCHILGDLTTSLIQQISRLPLCGRTELIVKRRFRTSRFGPEVGLVLASSESSHTTQCRQIWSHWLNIPSFKSQG